MNNSTTINRYDVTNHYWLVNGDGTQVYSSKLARFVSVVDVEYIAWLTAGGIATKIVSTRELKEVLMPRYPAGWGLSDVQTQLAAIDAKIEAVVKTQGWIVFLNYSHLPLPVLTQMINC